MTTVREAFDAMGYTLSVDETVCVATLTQAGMQERSLQDAADEEIGVNRYFSTGTFTRKQRWGKGGRTQKNVLRILEFPFDFDLKDFLGIDKEDLYDLDDDELQSYVADLRAVVEGIFGALMLPIHRLDYTGYGISAHINIPKHQPEAVPELKKIHEGIVTKINAMYGGVLADAQVKDAGSRVMRLVPCLNVGTYKDGRTAPPRQTRNLYRLDGVAGETILRAAASTPSWKRAQDIPLVGESLSADDAQRIVDLYRPHNIKGQKHVFCLAVAAQLGKAGMAEEQALQIVKAISTGDQKPWDREKAVTDTYEKLRDGVVVSGYYALRNYVDEDTIAEVDTILEPIRKKQGPKLILMGGKADSAPSGSEHSHFRPTIPPDSCFYGWHREWRDLVSPTTGAADAFHLAASTTLQAATMARRISTRYAGSRVMPNLFSIAVGRTGHSYKDTAYWRTMDMRTAGHDILRSRGDNVLINDFSSIYDLASREAMVRSLSAHSNRYLFASEFTPILKNAGRDSTATLLDGLIFVWDSPDFIENNSVAAKKDMGNIAMNPTLNIYGGIQPLRMSEEMTDNVMTSGLGNRMAIFMGNAKGRFANTPDLDMQRAGELYVELWDAIQSYPVGSQIRMDSASEAIWEEWYLNQPIEEDELANDMKVRHPIMVQKWALMFAVTDRSKDIRPQHLLPAMEICDWMWSNIRVLLPSWGVSVDRKIEERILSVLKDRQPILKRDLNRYVRGRWSAQEFARVFRAMKENHQLVMDATEKYVVLPEFADKQAGVA